MPNKVFPVFGDTVEVMISAKSTGGALCAIVQSTRPGSGPPPHIHDNEDEVLMALEGDFELFQKGSWTPLKRGQPLYLRRGEMHAFRNCGTAMGKMLAIATPGGLDEYLESISPIRMPEDANRLVEISAVAGITFPQL